ncbi:uncharacterized protein [Apostichopus japonicus]|uniref:uncharacterized protein n=1 Tax=Stichopus japonicus TaxID=307972 RepID=UPI003AB31F4E
MNLDVNLLSPEKRRLLTMWVQTAWHLLELADELEHANPPPQPQAHHSQQGRRRRRARRRRLVVRDWLARRPLFGQYEHLLVELNREDSRCCRNFLRVDADTFGYILDRISPAITKKTTNFMFPLEPGLKLAVTLRHLATGASHADLQYGADSIRSS